MDEAAFRDLRWTTLHRLVPAEWDAWYPRMAAYLDSPDPAVRDVALERLMMATFRAEACPKGEERGAGRRAAWLLDVVTRAHGRHADLLPALLRGLRWHGDDAPFPGILLPWLRDLRACPPPGVPDELAEGAEILVGGVRWDGPGLPPQLDHPSDWVRGCAACALGRWGFGDDDRDVLDPGVLAAVTAKELERPGIAGPYWSGLGFFGDAPEAFDPLAWMLDIVERRRAPEPAGLPFNGIDFHVHELAAGHPEAIHRLVRAGRLDLALEAALEIRGPAAGMAPVLRGLAAHSDPAVAHAARIHLARYHGEMTPGADPDRLSHRAGWRPGADLFVIRRGGPEAWSSTVVLVPAGRGPFDDAEARAMIDAALPTALRGEPVRHDLAAPEDGAGPLRLGSDEMHAFAAGAEVTLSGDPDARRWSRIEIDGGRLRERWHPLREPDRWAASPPDGDPDGKSRQGSVAAPPASDRGGHDVGEGRRRW